MIGLVHKAADELQLLFTLRKDGIVWIPAPNYAPLYRSAAISVKLDCCSTPLNAGNTVNDVDHMKEDMIE
jgi:hypothetical protein